MIPNQWYAILESNEVKPGRPVAVKRMGERLVFWRDTRGNVTCMRDLWPRRGKHIHLEDDETLTQREVYLCHLATAILNASVQSWVHSHDV